MIEVELPDGRVVEINTTDPQVAAQAAQKFLSSSNTPDKYAQAAIDERDALKAKGVGVSPGLTRRLAQGATFNAADEILAGLSTPLEMFKRGVGPREGYKYAKAREDLIMDDSRKNTGGLGTALEIAGGIGSGAGLARAGATFGGLLSNTAGLGARSAASAADAAIMGGVAGGFEGNSLGERASNALSGAALGGLLGGITPSALAIGSTALSPVVSNLRARINPEGFATSQLARGISESGLTPQQIGRSVSDAAADGQGMFTIADALGNPGQRLLSTVTRAPGAGRTDTVNFLDARQAGQSRRVANTLAEGFDSPQTGAQTEARLTQARDAAANAEYGANRAGAGRVDVVPAINNIDRTIGTQPGQVLQATNDSVEGALRPFRERLSRVNPNDYEAVQRIRYDMADAAQSARQSGYGNRARLIGNAVRELDNAMEAASPGFRQANRNYAQSTRDIEAVQAGRDAAMRGRTEDTLQAFGNLGQNSQQAFRAGYADPLIASAQSSAFGSNAARPLTSIAFRDEAAALAPRNTQMQNRLARENTMFETRNAAMGGSKTVDNLADAQANGIDPSLVFNIINGNWQGALRSVAASGSNALTGNTPAVREALGRMLRMSGPDVTPQALSRLVDSTLQRIQYVQRLAQNAGRGASGGLAIAAPGQQKN